MYVNVRKGSKNVRVHPDAVDDVEALVSGNGGPRNSNVERMLARRNTTVKTKEHYRRGSIVIEKLRSA